MILLTLDTPVEQLTRVGKSVSKRLGKIGIATARDLLVYYPARYVDYSKISPIAHLVPGENVTVKGVVEIIQNRRSFRKKMMLTEAVVSDNTGRLKVIWFHQPYLTKVLHPGDEVFLSGELQANANEFQFTSPMYEKVKDETIHTARIIPVYPATKDLTQKQIRFLVRQVISLAQDIPEWIPHEFLKEYRLPVISWTIENIHFPKNYKDLELARKRLAFDELLIQQIKVQWSKKEIQKQKARKMEFKKKEIREFTTSLPYKLTTDQKIASWQILQDMMRERPANRLLEGDVGSGKTVVAVLAMLNAAMNGFQAVFLAPTEVLSFQHHEKIAELVKKFHLRIALVTRSKKALNAKKVSESVLKKEIREGRVDIVVGTHALLSEDVQFREIGLVVIDEQHRFGVEQRKLITEKSAQKKFFPHLVSMTATPIPRSLSLVLYGDLDISVIREMPKGRKKIITKIVLPENRSKAYEFIRQKIASLEQVFVVCPLIDPSDKLGVKSVTEEHKRLASEIFPDIPMAYLHGKMKPIDKEAIMRKFRAGECKILVATSVIEVGVDVPQATIMLIEGAERFGLSQLHQFRGRVGRSELQSYCFLFVSAMSEKVRHRLNAFLQAKDCFELAKLDLEMRGPGDVYGTEQSGFPEFQIARLTDIDAIQKAKQCAERLAHISLEHYPVLRDVVKGATKRVHLE